MTARLAADAVLLLHLAFVLFVVLGGLLVLRWPRLAWLHLPAVAWGVAIEAGGWLCPLTGWENALRESAGEGGYGDSFIEHYLLPVIYPAGLTRATQWLLAGFVLALNAFLYALIWRRTVGKRSPTR